MPSSSAAGGSDSGHDPDMLPVLVVGAGPVGLTAAAFLSRLGVRVRVVDAAPEPSPFSRSLVLWRRTLLTLDPLVPADGWASPDDAVARACFGDEGRVVAELPLGAAGPAAVGGAPHALPAGVFVSQADVEAALAGALRGLGATVERGVRLAAFEQAEGGAYVRCTLVRGGRQAAQQQRQGEEAAAQEQEEEEVVLARYLVACDGGRSTVRKALGCPFAGTTRTGRWLLADCMFEERQGEEGQAAAAAAHPCELAPQPGALLLSTTAAGVMGLVPFGSQQRVTRIVWSPAPGHEPGGELCLRDFQRLLDQHTLQRVRLLEPPLWLSEFKINERQVASYVHGCVLLAGDAAHVHSPAGGQGLNTGVQDAANLAWKLAAALRGDATDPDALVGTYQEERWPIGARVLRFSGALLRANAITSPALRFVRRWALWLLLRSPAVCARMTAALAQDDISYPSDSSLAVPAPAAAAAAPAGSSAAQRALWGTCRPGCAFPDAAVAVGGQPRPACELLRGGGGPGTCGCLVVLRRASDGDGDGGGGGGAEQPPPGGGRQDDGAWPERWGTWRLHIAEVAPAAGAGSPGAAAVDAWGLLAASFGAAAAGAAGAGAAGTAALVRPDGVVAAVGGPAQVRAWLDRHISGPGGGGGGGGKGQKPSA